jgi:hypothetical protein
MADIEPLAAVSILNGIPIRFERAQQDGDTDA